MATATTLMVSSSSSSSSSCSRAYSIPSYLSRKWLKPKVVGHQQQQRFNHNYSLQSSVTVRALSLDFSSASGGSFFEGGFDEDPPSSPTATAVAEDKPQPQCPPGLRQYETMAVLRPDMTEDERLSLTQKYEELLVAGGAMYVEVFNRGVIPLAYSIKKKNKAGETNTYLDGIYLLFTYFTKPESLSALEVTLKADDDVIRSTSFKIRKRKY